MKDWLSIMTGEASLPPYVSPFAKSASGSSEEDDDEEDDEEGDDEEDDEEDDPDEGKSDEELRAELKATRDRLKKANDSSKKRRLALRKEREAAARKPKPKKSDDDDKPDLEALREEARREGEKGGNDRAKLAEAKAALVAAGVPRDRAARAARMLDLDDLELIDDELDGIDDAIDTLKADMPEFFAKTRRRRGSIAGEGDRDGKKPRAKDLSTSERQALALTRGGR